MKPSLPFSQEEFETRGFAAVRELLQFEQHCVTVNNASRPKLDAQGLST